MSDLPYEQVYNNLPEDMKRIFDKWCEGARDIKKGEDVLENIKLEKQFEVGLFTEFLMSVAQSYQKVLDAGFTDVNPRTIYENICQEHRFHFKGKVEMS